MDTELRKRLEEAAEKYAKKVVPECISSYEEYFEDTKADFRNGAKFGYKEAIKSAKKWLEEHGKLDKLDLVEFDMEMNKLLLSTC